MINLMRLRALLLIFVFVSMSGVFCAIVCPDDTLDSHDTKCTQCISADVLVSTKTSDHHTLDPNGFCCPASMHMTDLSRLEVVVDHPRVLTYPAFHPPEVFAIRV
jgi:hypothetical protein